MDIIVDLWGFDPGLVSGWAHFSIHEDEIGTFECGETDHIGIGNMLYDNPSLKSAIDKPEISVNFVAERFVMNSKVTPQPWSLETIGLIRYFASHYHIPFELVSPSSHKSLITNDIIKQTGLWTPSKDGHQMDALRIALYFLIVKLGLLKECLKT